MSKVLKSSLEGKTVMIKGTNGPVRITEQPNPTLYYGRFYRRAHQSDKQCVFVRVEKNEILREATESDLIGWEYSDKPEQGWKYDD